MWTGEICNQEVRRREVEVRVEGWVVCESYTLRSIALARQLGRRLAVRMTSLAVCSFNSSEAALAEEASGLPVLSCGRLQLPG